MPNANLIELETSLKDCLRYCEQQPNSELAKLYYKRLKFVSDQLHQSIKESDQHHARWRTEEREQLVSWKQLAHALRDTQNKLRRIGALGFPEQRIMYWNTDALLRVVAAMDEYLREHADSIEFAIEDADKMQRIISQVNAEAQDEDIALKSFQRFVELRREGIAEAGNMIGEFRQAMRRVLGKRHDDYQNIFWPYAIASDENVLF